MRNFYPLLETYFTVLVHPFRIHEQFRHRLPINGYQGHLYEPLTLTESLGISWIFAVLRGLCKIVFLNFFLQNLLALQSESFPVVQELVKNSGISAYYFLLFSATLDIIFFPIGALIMTELWAWVIKLYGRWLNPDLPLDEISDQVATHALSSNVFYMIPFLGDVLQNVLYYFLIYAGLRSNLGASRSLALVILITPMVFGLMAVTLLLFMLFYLVA